MLPSLYLDDLLVTRAAEDDRNITLVNFKVFCEQFADGLVCGPFDGRCLDFDLVGAVGLWRYAFAFAAGVYFDIDAHGMVLSSLVRCPSDLAGGAVAPWPQVPSGRFPWRRAGLLALESMPCNG